MILKLGPDIVNCSVEFLCFSDRQTAVFGFTVCVCTHALVHNLFFYRAHFSKPFSKQTDFLHFNNSFYTQND